MTLSAIGVAGYAFAYAFLPHVAAGNMKAKLFGTPLPALAHFIGGGIALFIGPFQFNTRLRNRFLNGHRWAGRVYLLAVLLGGIAAVTLAFNATGGLPSELGFGLLGSLWIISAGFAYSRIRSGDLVGHEYWMIRNYALTLSAVTLRIYLTIVLVNDIAFIPAYQVIAWLCWVPNLIIAEWIISIKKNASKLKVTV